MRYSPIGRTCGNNFIKDPGLTSTLFGDGIRAYIGGLIGGPANTTYSEKIGVVVLTGVYDTFVLRVTAIINISNNINNYYNYTYFDYNFRNNISNNN